MNTIYECWFKYRNINCICAELNLPYSVVSRSLNKLKEYKNRKKILTLERTASIRFAQKELLIEKLGGKCNKCDCQDYLLLQFHHHDKNKEKTVGSLMQGNWNKLYKEAKKCTILCANCHHLEHTNLNRLNEIRYLIDARKERFKKFGYI